MVAQNIAAHPEVWNEDIGEEQAGWLNDPQAGRRFTLSANQSHDCNET
jgi:hypothetical protein